MAGNKPKFDKQMCLKCKWHGTGGGWRAKLPNGKTQALHCNYSGYHDSTPLRAVSSTEVIDLRGDDFHNCSLFVEGTPNEKETEGKFYDDNRDLLQQRL